MAESAEPPSYSATTTQRSIMDLRSQILANASIMNPKCRTERPSDDHVEVIVAATNQTSSLQHHSTSEKQRAVSPASISGPSESGGHYAVLVKRTHDKKWISILAKTKPKVSIEEALEDLLRMLEVEAHERVTKFGHVSSGEECCVM